MKRLILLTPALLAPALVLSGCNQQLAAPADSAAALDAIHSAEKAQIKAFSGKDLDGGLAVYADRSAFIASGGPYLDGLAAIRPAMKAMLDDPNAALQMTSRGSMVAASGDLAVTTADFIYTHTDPETGKAVSEKGVNQTVWQKQDDGSWKNMSDFNVTVPEEESPAAE